MKLFVLCQQPCQQDENNKGEEDLQNEEDLQKEEEEKMMQEQVSQWLVWPLHQPRIWETTLILLTFWLPDWPKLAPLLSYSL